MTLRPLSRQGHLVSDAHLETRNAALLARYPTLNIMEEGRLTFFLPLLPPFPCLLLLALNGPLVSTWEGSPKEHMKYRARDRHNPYINRQIHLQRRRNPPLLDLSKSYGEHERNVVGYPDVAV